MNLCSKCIQLAGLTIEHPQMLKVFDGCDNCMNIKKKSFDIIDVIKQSLLEGNR